MTNEETLAVPDTWRHVVHPRRRGMLGLEPSPVDELVAARGLARAAAAFVESRADLPGHSGPRHLRSLLAVAPQDAYDETVAALTPLRVGSLRQRIVALAFESSRGELGVFGDLPLVTRSELIRSLRTLD